MRHAMADEKLAMNQPEEMQPASTSLSQNFTEAIWYTKLCRACCMREYDMIARICLSVGKDAAAFVEALAHECIRRDVRFFTLVLRAARLHDVNPQLTAELYHLVEPWLREQCADHAAWEAVLYALALQALDARESPDAALQILSEMESGTDPRLPEPSLAAYCILVPAIAASLGLRAARQLLSRSAARALRADPIVYLMLAVVHADADIDMAKILARKGEMLTREFGQSSMLEFEGCLGLDYCFWHPGQPDMYQKHYASS